MDAKNLSENLAARAGIKFVFQVILFVSFSLNIITGLAAYNLSTKAVRTILTPPVITKSFWVDGENLDPAHIEQMANFVIQLYTTFTPHNINYNNENLLRKVDARSYQHVAVQLKQREQKIKAQALSQVFYPNDIMIEARNNRAVIYGTLNRFIVDKPLDKGVTRAYLVEFGNLNGYMSIIALRETNLKTPFAPMTEDDVRKVDELEYLQSEQLERSVPAEAVTQPLELPPPPPVDTDHEEVAAALRRGEFLGEKR